MKQGGKDMCETIKITKRLILYAVLSLIAMILINVNIEKNIFFVDKAWISNDMLMNITGGLLAGFTAVVFEKVYKYRLDKAQAIRNLSAYLVMLYAELYYWICNIKELDDDKNVEIPQNLFSGKRPIIDTYLWNISNIDYCEFWHKGNLQKIVEDFAVEGIGKIRMLQSKMIYLNIALSEKQINVCKNAPYIENEYKVLHIISCELQQVCDNIESVLKQIEKTDKQFDWGVQKEKIVEGYLGLYPPKLEEFIGDEKR